MNVRVFDVIPEISYTILIFEFFFFWFCCSNWVISMILSPILLINFSSVLTSLPLIPSNVLFISAIIHLWLVLFYILYLVIDVFSEFLHCILKFINHPYNCFFKFFIKQNTFLCFIRIFFFFLEFFLVLSFEAYTSVSTFCLTFCACSYKFDRTAISSNFERAVSEYTVYWIVLTRL